MWVREIYGQLERKEVYNTSGTWLHSLTENYISGTMQFITSREEVMVKKKPIGKDKCKIKQNKVILKFVFLIFAFL